MLKLVSLILALFMVFAPTAIAQHDPSNGGTVAGVTGFYFLDRSGYAVWWVWVGQTPAEALYIAAVNGNMCVGSSIIRSLQSQFPSDPFVSLIPSSVSPVNFCGAPTFGV